MAIIGRNDAPFAPEEAPPAPYDPTTGPSILDRINAPLSDPQHYGLAPVQGPEALGPPAAPGFVPDTPPTDPNAPPELLARPPGMVYPQPGGPNPPPGSPPAPALPPGALRLPGTGTGGGSGAPDYSGDASKAFDAYRKATGAAGDADAQMAQARGQGMQAIAQQQQAAYQQAQQQRAAVEQEYRANMAKYQQGLQQLSEQKEDPNHWWSTRDTGQKVAAAISMALGGFAQATTGHNTSQVMDLIHQDIESQRQNYQRKKDSLVAQESAYGKLREMGLSDNEATLNLKMGQLQGAQQQMEGMLTEQSAPALKARAQAQIAQIGVEQAKTQAQMQAEAAQTAATKVNTQVQRQGLLFQQQDRARMQAFFDGGQVPPQLAERAVRIPGGGVVLAGSKEGKEKLESVYRASSDIDDAAQEMQKIARANPNDVMRPGSEAYRRYNILKDNIINLTNPSKGINAQMGEEQRKLYSAGMDPALLGSTDALINSIEGYRRETRSSANKAFYMETGHQPFAEAPPSLRKGTR